jgi:hypothetical protein
MIGTAMRKSFMLLFEGKINALLTTLLTVLRILYNLGIKHKSNDGKQQGFTEFYIYQCQLDYVNFITQE